MLYSPTRSRYRSSLAAMLIAALASWPAQSVQSREVVDLRSDRQCGASSPRLLSMGDSYYDLDLPDEKDHDLNLSGQVSQEKLRSALLSADYSSGHARITDCFGSGDSLQPRTHVTTLHDISGRTESRSHYSKSPHRSGAVIFELTGYDQDQKVSRRETLLIPASAVAIDTSSGLLINSGHRHRQKTEKGSYLRETALTALQTDEALIIEQSVFVNGSLAQWTTWRMQP